mmetsp:Transcript_12454/g.44794  ORF Transcript_12454/g.44794 Transcript_12454/m.44794 type:complete len:231 (+) Transcript_12454:547-1239(+)
MTVIPGWSCVGIASPAARNLKTPSVNARSSWRWRYSSPRRAPGSGDDDGDDLSLSLSPTLSLSPRRKKSPSPPPPPPPPPRKPARSNRDVDVDGGVFASSGTSSARSRAVTASRYGMIARTWSSCTGRTPGTDGSVATHLSYSATTGPCGASGGVLLRAPSGPSLHDASRAIAPPEEVAPASRRGGRRATRESSDDETTFAMRARANITSRAGARVSATAQTRALTAPWV